MKEMFLRAILTVDETMNTVTMILSIVSGILAIVAEFKIRSRRNKKSWVIKLIIIVSIIVVTCTVVRKNITQQGFLYIDGRIKRIIIRHDGFKVFPTQIENVIATCPEVKTCCAIGRADKDHSQGKLPVVYITLSREKKDKMKLKEELNSLCKQMLPEYMQPIDFVFIDKMPLTANGKVDFHELEGIELSNRL